MTSTLVDTFEAFGLEEQAVPFAPTGSRSWIVPKLHHIPPYLFRVYTPRSAGFNNEEWVRSRDARYSTDGHDIDIFETDDRAAADMINTHLRWWGKNGQSINLVSWTSSLLFALTYIFHLHRSGKDSSSLDDIKICVIDTRLFPDACFIRDMDLIQAYQSQSATADGLAGLARLRNRQHGIYRGSYYFGEYLSQGALRVQDRCSIVSASAMINGGLFNLQPLLRDYENWPTDNTPWANEAVRFREDFYNTGETERQVTDTEKQAVLEIATLFSPSYRLPMAASLLGLTPRQSDDAQLLQLFRSSQFPDAARVDCIWFNTMPIQGLLPEVTQFRKLIKVAHEDYCKERIEDILNGLGRIETDLRAVTVYSQSEHFGEGLKLSDPNLRPTLRSRLSNIGLLAKALRQDLRDVRDSQL